MSEGKGKEWVHQVCFNAYFEDALAKFRAKSGFGVTYAILNALNEFWYKEGCMSEEGYKFNKEKYGLTLIENLKRKGQAFSKETKQETKKEVPKKKLVQVDYSKLDDDALLEAYKKAVMTNDVVAPNLIQGEAIKRGYRFKADAGGNVEIVSLKGVSQRKIQT